MRSQILVVMGVSGAGKSTLAAALGEHLGWAWIDGDDLHPPSNIATLRAGIPLTDADREPWLTAVGQWMVDRERQQTSGVVACSALKRTYRERLRAEHSSVVFVHLDVPREILRERIDRRTAHVMPATLLADQLATLEPLEPDEPGFLVDGTVPIPQLCSDIARRRSET